MNIKLSVCLITKNEEINLPACLDSVKDIADEIIIADTGSSDNTIAIAKSFGAKLIEIPWKNDFSFARNVTLDMAQGDFILVIDADERLLNPDLLVKVISNPNTKTGGWLIEVNSEALREDGSKDIYVGNLLRLFRNHPNIRFKGIIHEQIFESVINSGLAIENTKIELKHIGYGLSPEIMRQKQIRNLNLLDEAITHEPENAYHYYQRAKTHLALRNLAEAENDIQKALRYASKGGSIRPIALNFGAIIAYQQKNLALAENRASESLSLLNNQSFANFILGEVNAERGNHAAAWEAYNRMNDSIGTEDPITKVVGDYYLPPEKLAYRIGRALVGLGMYDKAIIEFEKGLRINPNDVTCLVGAANVAYNYKMYSQAKALMERALLLEPERNDLKNYLAQINNTNVLQEPVKSYANSNPAKPFISLSMIVRNEEEYISSCLESVRGIVDEMIVVDTGSTDSTKEIARRYGATVIDFPWVNDFAKARNEALKNSSGEWIIYLDADERLEGNKSELKSTLSQLGDEIGGLICTIESEHLQLDGRTELHRGGYPRIFRNYGYPRIQFTGRVHEQITPSIIELDKSFLHSDIIIKHLGYNRTREEMEKKIQRNYALLLQHVKEEPLNAYAWYQLGQTLAQMQLITQAEEAIRFALNSGKLSASVYASASATLSQLTGGQKKFTEALFWAEESLKKAPTQVYALHLKAYALMYLKQYDDAESVFNEVLTRMENKKGVPLTGFDIDIPNESIHKGLSELNRLRNQAR